MTLVGTTIGRIRVVETLGKGGMGEVYVGYDEKLKRKVALKAIRDERRLDEEAKARFLREARILSQLDHPAICRIHELIEGDDSDILVLELIPGKSLKEALAEDELDSGFRLHVAEQVTEALVAAHAQGIAHRDLKPENVMLTPEGGVKVLDFGLAYNPHVAREARPEKDESTPGATAGAQSQTALDRDGEMGDVADDDSTTGTGATVVPEAAGRRPLTATVPWSGIQPTVEPGLDPTRSGPGAGARSNGAGGYRFGCRDGERLRRDPARHRHGHGGLHGARAGAGRAGHGGR